MNELIIFKLSACCLKHLSYLSDSVTLSFMSAANIDIFQSDKAFLFQTNNIEDYRLDFLLLVISLSSASQSFHPITGSNNTEKCSGHKKPGRNIGWEGVNIKSDAGRPRWSHWLVGCQGDIKLHNKNCLSNLLYFMPSGWASRNVSWTASSQLKICLDCIISNITHWIQKVCLTTRRPTI